MPSQRPCRELAKQTAGREARGFEGSRQAREGQSPGEQLEKEKGRKRRSRSRRRSRRREDRRSVNNAVPPSMATVELGAVPCWCDTLCPWCVKPSPAYTEHLSQLKSIGLSHLAKNRMGPKSSKIQADTVMENSMTDLSFSIINLHTSPATSEALLLIFVGDMPWPKCWPSAR